MCPTNFAEFEEFSTQRLQNLVSSILATGLQLLKLSDFDGYLPDMGQYEVSSKLYSTLRHKRHEKVKQ